MCNSLVQGCLQVAETVQLNRLEDKSHQVGMMEEAFAQKERTLLTLNMREKNSRDSEFFSNLFFSFLVAILELTAAMRGLGSKSV